jgi:hypothetical protein
MTVFKNPRDKSQVVCLARQVYPENISSFHGAYLEACRAPHSFLFLDFSQSSNDILRFRTKIFPGKITEVYAPISSNELREISKTFPTRA